jgi:hypothetical protein
LGVDDGDVTGLVWGDDEGFVVDEADAEGHQVVSAAEGDACFIEGVVVDFPCVTGVADCGFGNERVVDVS